MTKITSLKPPCLFAYINVFDYTFLNSRIDSNL